MSTITSHNILTFLKIFWLKHLLLLQRRQMTGPGGTLEKWCQWQTRLIEVPSPQSGCPQPVEALAVAHHGKRNLFQHRLVMISRWSPLERSPDTRPQRQRHPCPSPSHSSPGSAQSSPDHYHWDAATTTTPWWKWISWLWPTTLVMTDDLIVGQADGVNVVGKLKVSLHKNKGNGVAWKYWLYSLIIIKLLLQNQNH